MDFGAFCSHYPRWAGKQPEGELADSELTLLGDLAEAGLGVDRLVGVFAAGGVNLSEDALVERLGGYLKFRNVVPRLDAQGTVVFMPRTDGGGGGAEWVGRDFE